MPNATRFKWMPLGFLLLIALGMLGWGSWEESQYKAVLRRLQQQGHQVRAAEVHIQEHRGGRYFVSTIEVRYRFLPLERKELDEPPAFNPAATEPSDLVRQIENFEKWSEKTLKENPWIWGSHRISDETRSKIEHGDRIVTYLPDEPEVNLIGQLTEERIRREWRSNPFVETSLLWLISLSVGATAFWLLARRNRGKALNSERSWVTRR